MVSALLAQSVWLPTDASTLAPEYDSLFYFVLWTSVVIFVGVMAAMGWFMYKYRRQSPDERPELVEENKLIEISWVIIPTILVLIVFTWGFRAFIKFGVAPPNAYEITVRAQQWSWLFTYPNGVQSANLHVPADRPVRLRMSSTDVIHSFAVPEFRVKQDVLPNRYSYLWFEPTKTGTFDIFCTEYCGTQHSGMLAEVVVQSQAEFEQWLEEAGTPEDMPLPQLGERLYTQQGCQACHSVDGSQMVGPTFQNLYGTERQFTDGTSAVADDNYLRQSILNPGEKIVEGYQNVMPASYGTLSDQQLSALVAYIESLSEEAAAEEATD
jgi:cytochrome c oxidase subunit 2